MRKSHLLTSGMYKAGYSTLTKQVNPLTGPKQMDGIKWRDKQGQLIKGFRIQWNLCIKDTLGPAIFVLNREVSTNTMLPSLL